MDQLLVIVPIPGSWTPAGGTIGFFGKHPAQADDESAACGRDDETFGRRGWSGDDAERASHSGSVQERRRAQVSALAVS